MPPQFYILGHPDHPWGDYGDILVHGMAHRDDNGELELERTGPFIPPITLPGMSEVVVTYDLRHKLLQSGLQGFAIEKVTKTLIVGSDWHTWDQDADEPAEHPESGEPEDYVLGQPHSPEASAQMGDVWCLKLDNHAET